MTTNAGAQFARQTIGFSPKVSASEAMLRSAKKTFKPEFLNRLSSITVFNDMNHDMAEKILNKKLGYLHDKLSSKKIVLDISSESKKFLLAKGFSQEYGGREIDRVISTHLKPILMRALLIGELTSGAVAKIIVENDSLKLEMP
jgi:ATP-dependent Clp protease ATP-binding subunit ClpA